MSVVPDTLSAIGVGVEFGAVRALDEVDLTTRRGEILGVIGPNGSGKTTLVNVLTGFVKPTRGNVVLGDRDITSLPIHSRARLGVARTFQNIRLFGRLTVRENVEVAALMGGLRRRAAKERSVDLLGVVGLAAKAGMRAEGLAYGEARRLEMARALAMTPLFVLLDEPAAGMHEAESIELVETVAKVRDTRGCGILIIDHDMSVIMNLCDRIHVLDYGRTIALGSPAEIASDPAVIDAYIGAPRA